jgi:hypothetical protein
VHLTGPLAQLFTPPGSTPLVQDPTGGGFVHAPSPAQATTAAVLRAGYLANASPDNRDAFAVNLSSERVRQALSVLDGMRQGQALGAILGYRFERGLHDRFGEAELDTIIDGLRGAFPLRAGKLSTAEPGTPAELVEARNVIDGLALVRVVTRTDATEYPFGAKGLPPASPAQLDALHKELDRPTWPSPRARTRPSPATRSGPPPRSTRSPRRASRPTRPWSAVRAAASR